MIEQWLLNVNNCEQWLLTTVVDRVQQLIKLFIFARVGKLLTSCVCTACSKLMEQVVNNL